MTESEWLTCQTPRQLFGALGELATERKVRLFACACCRVIWDRLPDDRSRQAVAAAERFAEGQTTATELALAYRAARAVHDRLRDREESHLALAAAETARSSFLIGSRVDPTLALGQALAVYSCYPAGNLPADLVREIFGNPFRSVALDTTWLTEKVQALVLEMAEQADFKKMPLLADALQAAKCDQAELLAHCRQRKPHARGCWAVDILLSRE
jgi:hypothetical protein